ncbi:M20 family metallo-hydrolase [Microbacterium kribbense]|uniref:M20 family metallo-hydrolase n=1 Tax=Microbacterium kribbense TaxID=433645 RepID=A0ABP7G5U1_9MICO
MNTDGDPTGAQSTADVDGARFLRDFAALSLIGRSAGGGVDREAATVADHESRAWWSGWLEANGFDVRIDQIGNVFGLHCFVPGAPYVLLGSHLDSQPLAGRFDGAYGVLAAGHAARAVADRVAMDEIVPTVNVAVVDWFNEEGSRFSPSMMGSSVATGKLALADALTITDAAGITVAEALTPDATFESPLEVGNYAEIHIEQGRILEDSGATIGLVDGTWAASKYVVRVHGDQAHTGATIMADRHDALYGAALTVVAARELTNRVAAGKLHTAVSTMRVLPNSPVTIARFAEFNLDLRSADEAVLEEANRLLEEEFARIETTARVTIERTLTHEWGLRSYTPAGVALATSAAEAAGLPASRILTVAGHDSTNMKDVVPTVMLFIPSIEGISHNEKEDSTDADSVAGMTMLAEVASRLVQGELWHGERYVLPTTVV